MIEKGVFRSYWGDGSHVEQPAELDTETGQVTITGEPIKDMKDFPRGGLVKDEFENEDGDTYDICMTCFSHIMKSVMVDDKYIPTVLNEEFVCSDPDCESQEVDYDMDEYQDCFEDEDDIEEED